MGLPDFLKREVVADPVPKFTEALSRYKEHFGVMVSTAELTMSVDDIIDMINECIATETTWQDYLGHPGYDEDTDY